MRKIPGIVLRVRASFSTLSAAIGDFMAKVIVKFFCKYFYSHVLRKRPGSVQSSSSFIVFLMVQWAMMFVCCT